MSYSIFETGFIHLMDGVKYLVLNLDEMKYDLLLY